MAVAQIKGVLRERSSILSHFGGSKIKGGGEMIEVGVLGTLFSDIYETSRQIEKLTNLAADNIEADSDMQPILQILKTLAARQGLLVYEFHDLIGPLHMLNQLDPEYARGQLKSRSA